LGGETPPLHKKEIDPLQETAMGFRGFSRCWVKYPLAPLYKRGEEIPDLKTILTMERHNRYFAALRMTNLVITEGA
jgi:hypothetical protein